MRLTTSSSSTLWTGGGRSLLQASYGPGMYSAVPAKLLLIVVAGASSSVPPSSPQCSVVGPVGVAYQVALLCSRRKRHTGRAHGDARHIYSVGARRSLLGKQLRSLSETPLSTEKDSGVKMLSQRSQCHL